MRMRLIRDIIIYMIFPVLFFNMSKVSDLILVAQVTCAIAVIYSVYTKFIEHRLNFSGILFLIFFVSCSLIKLNLPSKDAYFYNTCILLAICLIIPMLRVLNKDICVSILKDILVALNKNSLAILRLLKKKSIINEIKRTSSIIETSLGVVVLMRMINIISFASDSDSYINFLIRFVSFIAVIIVIYKVVKLIYASRDLKTISKNPSNNDDTKGKVINFNNFK